MVLQFGKRPSCIGAPRAGISPIIVTWH